MPHPYVSERRQRVALLPHRTFATLEELLMAAQFHFFETGKPFEVLHTPEELALVCELMRQANEPHEIVAPDIFDWVNRVAVYLRRTGPNDTVYAILWSTRAF